MSLRPRSAISPRALFDRVFRSPDVIETSLASLPGSAFFRLALSSALLLSKTKRINWSTLVPEVDNDGNWLEVRRAIFCTGDSFLNMISLNFLLELVEQ